MRSLSDIVKERVKRGMALSALLHFSFVLPFIIIALPILRFAEETPAEEKPPVERVEREREDAVMMVDVLVFSENESKTLPTSQFLGIEGITQAPEFNESMKDTSEKTIETEDPDVRESTSETKEAEQANAERVETKRKEIEPVEKKEPVKEAEKATPEEAKVEKAKANTKEVGIEKPEAVETQQEAMKIPLEASERPKSQLTESRDSQATIVKETSELTPEQGAPAHGQVKTPKLEKQETASPKEAQAEEKELSFEELELPQEQQEKRSIPIEATASIPAPVAAAGSKPSRLGEEISRLPETKEGPEEETVTSLDAAGARQGKTVATEGRLGEMLQTMRELDTRLDRSLQEAPEEDLGDLRVQSILRLQDAAEQGYAHAQHGLAEILMKGAGKERVPEEAKKLLSSAARSGYVQAQVLLGYLAASDKEEAKNFPEALAWMKLAAERGNKAAIYGAEKLEKLMKVKEVIEAHKLAQKYRSFMAPAAPAPIIAGVQDTRAPDEILREASAAGDMETVQMMLARGADPNALDETGRSALINAAWRGRKKIVRLLLEKGADLTILDQDGMSAVNWAAVNGHGEVIQMLAADGANLNNRDHDGLTPLMRASWNGHTKAVSALLNQGANLDLRDRSGKSALDFARQEGHELIQRILLEGEGS